MDRKTAYATAVEKLPSIAYGIVSGRPDWGGKMMELPGGQSGLLYYIAFGIRPAGFLTALVENDLMGALAKADSANAKAIGVYANFLYNFAPSGCWGSKAKVAAWCDRGGLYPYAEVGED